MGGEVQNAGGGQVGDDQDNEEETPDDQIEPDIGTWVDRRTSCHAADDVGQIPDEGQAEREEEEVADEPRVSGRGDADQGE